MILSIADFIGIAGFIISIATFTITRFEKRKKLLIHLYRDYVENIDINNEFLSHDGEDVITVDIINQCEIRTLFSLPLMVKNCSMI